MGWGLALGVVSGLIIAGGAVAVVVGLALWRCSSTVCGLRCQRWLPFHREHRAYYGRHGIRWRRGDG